MHMQIILIAFFIGFLNAFRGSGWLQRHGYEMAAILLKWFIIPAIIFCSVIHFQGLNLDGMMLAIIAPVPYLFLMETGTGGCMQANIHNTVKSTKGWPPFANISDKVARAVLGSKLQTPPQYSYYKIWGFTYATLVSIVFTLPFIATSYKYSIPLLFFGLTCRYLVWRINEFLLMGIFTLMYLLSLPIIS